MHCAAFTLVSTLHHRHVFLHLACMHSSCQRAHLLSVWKGKVVPCCLACLTFIRCVAHLQTYFFCCIDEEMYGETLEPFVKQVQ